MHVVFHSRPTIWFLIQNNVFARTTFAGARFRSNPRKFPRRPIIRPEELVRRRIVKTLRSFVIDKRSPAHACCDIGCMSIPRSEEHTSELQSLMRISYAVFCLKKKKNSPKKKYYDTIKTIKTSKNYT